MATRAHASPQTAAQSQRQVSVPQHVHARSLNDCYTKYIWRWHALHGDKRTAGKPGIGFAFGGVDVSDDVLELVQGEASENPLLLQAGLARGQSTTPSQGLL